MTEPRVVLSGIRATGKLHLGNYIGALSRFAKMSQSGRYRCLFFAADLHTLTTLKEASEIRKHLPDIILDYLAAGIDMNNASIYAQSDVPIVTELCWYLACLTNTPDVTNQGQYKEKIEKKPETNNVGLLTYPILMAADILGPRAHFVPVGKDQTAHLELARDLARRFNAFAKEEYFPVPDALNQEMVLIPGLEARDERGNFPKMGKSDNNTINLSDSSAQLWEKIRVAPTDPARIKREDPGTPELCVIHALHESVSSPDDLSWVRTGCTTAGIGCVECKRRLADNIDDMLAEFHDRRKKLAERPEIVSEVLAAGKATAEKLFADTVGHVREVFGIGRYT